MEEQDLVLDNDNLVLITWIIPLIHRSGDVSLSLLYGEAEARRTCTGAQPHFIQTQECGQGSWFTLSSAVFAINGQDSHLDTQTVIVYFLENVNPSCADYCMNLCSVDPYGSWNPGQFLQWCDHCSPLSSRAVQEHKPWSLNTKHIILAQA